MSRDSPLASQTQNMLLGLPRELRDIIYQYSLSYDGGLAVEITWNTTKSHVRHMRIHGRQNQNLEQTPANVLKLVCKQTREETRNLIFKANDNIALFGMRFATPSSFGFQLFVGQLSSKTICNHLKRISVHGFPGVETTVQSPVAFKELAAYTSGFRTFCEQYPKTRVILQFRNVVNVDSDHWYYWAGALEYVLRGSSPLVFPISKPHFAAQIMQLEFAFKTTPKLPNNLRFSILDVYPESGVENELEYYRDMFALPALYIETLAFVTRRLFDDGI